MLPKRLKRISLWQGLVFFGLGILATPVLSRPVPLTYPQSGWVSIGANSSSDLVWRCPADRYSVGGGFETRPIAGQPTKGFTMIHSFPQDFRTWKLRLRNNDNVTRQVKIYNICAKTTDFR